jgi:hypothetical protein
MGNSPSGIITPAVVLIAFILIIVVSLVVSWLINPARYDSSRVHVFIAVLTGLGIFIVFLFYYSLVEVQQQQQRLAVIQETSRISDTVFNELLSNLQAGSSVIPSFIMSLFPLIKTVPVNTLDENTPVTAMEKMNISNRIFGLWLDVITANRFIDIHPIAYLTQFLQYAHSDQLHAQWELYKINYDATTQRFGDLLFQYNRQYNPQTREDYVRLAKQFHQDPAYTLLTKGK